jgi:hypothetical protein
MLRCPSAAGLFLAACFVLSVPVAAGPIISTDGQGNSSYGILFGEYAHEAGWSQTSGYTNVSITAEIDPGTGSGTTGTAYLMSRIGPGTTSAQQIATASFSATGTAFSPVLTTLFTGLTLGPGNYYLVLSSPTGLGWEETNGTSPVTASGVTYNSNASTFGNPLQAYAPASTFSSNDPELEFTATGTPSPVQVGTVLNSNVTVSIPSQDDYLLYCYYAGVYTCGSSRLGTLPSVPAPGVPLPGVNLPAGVTSGYVTAIGLDATLTHVVIALSSGISITGNSWNSLFPSEPESTIVTDLLTGNVTDLSNFFSANLGDFLSYSGTPVNGNIGEFSNGTVVGSLSVNLTTATPEPATLGLLGCGLAGLAFLHRGRSQRGK